MATANTSLFIAFASSDGQVVDGHFGSCEQFYIYRLSDNELEFVESREAKSGRGTEKNALRAQLISDCQLMFCASIGGPAAARVIRTGIHPMKSKYVDQKPAGIQEQLQLLQKRMQSQTLPPWLAKLMGHNLSLEQRFGAIA